ncbi:hypothetical protein FE782_01030 [Paenibacillus antri]|uniref:MORN repeat protein n=1 Tax=Paenibacillus antri TaxID=2582848 RepID=A0A5R9GK88_9BACL|nr:hypothetical protein [Paenibacillus antri]TLS53964.1 hypothetical protein FE782_01030 [Paenibacillus antri]
MIEKIVKPFITPIQKKILMPLKRAKSWPKLLVKWLKKKFKEILGQKEITKASYVPIGNYYVSKKLIVIVVIVILALYFLIFIKPPKFVNKLLARKPAVTVAQDGTAAAYTGAAKLYAADGSLLFEGELAEGLYQGPGKLFEPDGSVLQEGTFEKGQLLQGSAYDSEGVLLYAGSFAAGMYSGQGTSYYPNGAVRYQGEFQAGMPSGQGRLFDEAGVLLYEGAFANGAYAGEGTEYDGAGNIRYQGAFLAGKYNGAGKLLTVGGVVRYEGMFSNGLPTGQGVMYYPNGGKQYEGAFAAGEYSGEGRLFATNGMPAYVGSFMAGKFHGDGERYGSLGTVEYRGKFANGRMNGPGTWLRPDGTVAFQGMFKDNEPDYAAFLGATAARLEELLGGPPTTFDIEGGAVTIPEAPTASSDDPATEGDAAEEAPAEPVFVPAEPAPNADLLLAYQDLRLIFVLSALEDGTNGVSEVRLLPGDALDRAAARLAESAAQEPSIGPFSIDADDERIYQWNGTTYTIRVDEGGKPVSGTVRKTV